MRKECPRTIQRVPTRRKKSNLCHLGATLYSDPILTKFIVVVVGHAGGSDQRTVQAEQRPQKSLAIYYGAREQTLGDVPVPVLLSLLE